jgi:hypothetical protein
MKEEKEKGRLMLFFSFVFQSTKKHRQTITQRAQYRTPPKRK